MSRFYFAHVSCDLSRSGLLTPSMSRGISLWPDCPLVAERLSNQEIVDRLFVSFSTAKTHVSHARTQTV
jgi:hypothetical protein